MKIRNKNMTNLTNTKKNPVIDFLKYSALGLVAVVMIYMTGMTTGTFAFAAQTPQETINLVLNIVFTIASIVGIFLTVLGIIRFVVAHANEQGPAQQQAIMMMAAGLMLLILPGILRSMNLVDKFFTDYTSTGGGANNGGGTVQRP